MAVHTNAFMRKTITGRHDHNSFVLEVNGFDGFAFHSSSESTKAEPTDKNMPEDNFACQGEASLDSRGIKAKN